MKTHYARTAKERICKALLAAVALDACRMALCTSRLRMIVASPFAVHQGVEKILQIVSRPHIERPVLLATKSGCSSRLKKHKN
jgi:hypothetical protein